MDVWLWQEIIVRIDPSFIFSCITVCKGWLELITDPEFRQRYNKRWRNNSKVVGLTTRTYRKLEFFATSKLGCIMNANESEHRSKYFISKSGDGLILYGFLPSILYVSKPDSNQVLWLGEVPRGCSSAGAVAILSQHSSFKVILITKNHDEYSKNIHTYTSATDKWRSCVHKVENKHIWRREAGIVSNSRGVVYWPQRGEKGCWVYDDNNEQKPLSWIAGPDAEPDGGGFENYGLSPQGHLLKATSFRTNNSPQGFGNKTKIWRLLDDDDDNKVWRLLYTLLPPNPTPKQFAFVSFFPGTLDSFIVESAGQLFCYRPHTHTQELVPLSEEKWMNRHRKLCLSPLTMADLGVWPSSPFSNTTKTNINIIKHMLGTLVTE